MRSTGPVDRYYFRPDRSTVRSIGPFGHERARPCTSAGRPGGRPTDPAVDRAVARLQDPNSRVVPVDRPGRPTAVKSAQRLFLEICFVYFIILIPISEFLVAKLYPNDLVFIMDDMNSLPINRGHWSFVFHKKYIQVLSFSKEKKSLLAFIFKVLSIAKVFSWFFKSP